MHTASPVKLELCEPSGVILPAVGGTTGLIESVISHGPSVKRVVYTSTCGAVLTPSREPRIYNENDWNDWSVRHCQEKGRDALPEWKYCASKVLAERAAWEMYEKHKAENKWDLVTIVPPWVYGPVLNASPSPKSLNSSMFEFYNAVFTTQKSEAELVSEGCVPLHHRICCAAQSFSSGGWIDVRDLADAHVKAITLPEAGRERIIVSTGPWRWQDWGSFPFIHISGPFTALLTILYISVNTAQSLSSKVVARDIFLNPKIAVHNTGYDLSKMKAILGPSRRSMLETTVDIIKDFESKGWLN